VHRGGDGEMDCLRWLSTKPGRSVVFVCFGSWAHFSARQVRELALGLEASNQTFLWVVRAGDSDTPEGWEGTARRRPRHGRARKLAVLAHPSVAVSVTHCRWNSVLEAAAAGGVRAVHQRAAGHRGGGVRRERVEDADIVSASAEFMEGGEHVLVACLVAL
jgi:hypothetical protein